MRNLQIPAAFRAGRGAGRAGGSAHRLPLPGLGRVPPGLGRVPPELPAARTPCRCLFLERLRHPCRFAFPWLRFYVPDTNRLTIPRREKACDCSRRTVFNKGCATRDHAAGRELLRCPTGGHHHATQPLFSLRPPRGCSSPSKGLAGEDGGWLPRAVRARAGRPPTPGRWYATSNSSLPPQEGAQAPLVEHRWLCSPLPGLSCARTALFFSPLF